MIDPDKACPHETFQVDATVNRITDGDFGPVSGYIVDVAVRCVDCNEPFQFLGISPGVDPTEPRASVDSLEARLPIRPASDRYLEPR